MARAPAYRAPQLATLVDAVPAGKDWLFEYKYDGYRLLVATSETKATAWTRNGKDWSAKFAGIVAAAAKLPAGCLVDGEAVALGDNGKPDFGKLQASLKDGATDLTFYAFDLLVDQGEDITGLTTLERKARLQKLLKKAKPPILYGDHIEAKGEALLKAICAEGGEGIIAKKAGAPYRAGRAKAWLKVKCIQRQEFVIVGWQDSEKARGFRSLHLGVHEKGKLTYAGKVGTGFNRDTMADILAKLKKLEAKEPAFDVPKSVRRRSHWVKPQLVAEVAFTEFTDNGTLRHPSFIALREDKPAKEIVHERATKLDAATLPTAANVGVKISSADRIIFPDAGVTKGDLADYVAAMAPLILETLGNRPMTLIRCPQGRGKHCFFQKHDSGAMGAHVLHVPIVENDGDKADYLYVKEAAGLVECVQMGTIEFHGWGSKVKPLEKPDRLVFDLDPDEGLSFADVRRAAFRLRDLLDELGLETFPMLTGGKGIHVIAPLTPKATWPTVKDFAERFARAVAEAEPELFTANIRKSARKGRIFLDWLRNQRGATAVMPYSARARDGAPVASPVTWDELDGLETAAHFTVKDAAELIDRAARMKGWGKADQVLPAR